ncbi:GAF domain-containing protein [Halogeometricum sp. S3BR5-2]|uniref:histidine kinase n=1 Tax=Halogeometricum luteum TaxID=2950537 RepID=A0ABU2G4Z0_9EURY|nr:GAF domain-containing protein [Halogeometricum sp. S3BR5-2]MDS0295848.1 GAF domain-containing protein [Halogeometricum sp. S3BR5-2]
MQDVEHVRLAADDAAALGGVASNATTGVGIATLAAAETGERAVDVAVVTDPEREFDLDVPVVCYADCDPESVPRPERFDAFVPRGDEASLRTQIRWLRSRAERCDHGRSRLKRLYEGTSTLIAAETTDELFARTIDIAERILAFDNSSISIDVGGSFRVSATDTATDEGDLIPLGQGILGETYRTGESKLVDDVREHGAAAPDDPAFRSVVSVPIGDIGVFQAISTEVGAYDETDRQLAELLVSYVAETAARIESEAALRESRGRIEALHRGTVELAAVTDLAELFERTVGITAEILSFDLSYIGVVEGGYIVPAATSEEFPEDGAEVKPLEDGGVAAHVHHTGQTRLVTDMAEAEDARPTKDDYRSGVSVPVGDIAVFQAAAYTPNAFDEADVELTELLMAHVAVTAERIRAEESLRDERDRSTALFEHVSDAAVAYEVDDGGTARVQSVNRAFEERFGRRAVDVVGGDLVDEIVPDDEADPLELRVAGGERHRGEVRRLAADGAREFILNVVPLDPDASDGRGYALYTDITERKRRESELERQNERLEEFANIVSHDLRNPLAVAQGHLDLARETDREESFETVANSLAQMERLIDDLLSLARQGNVVGETDAVDVATTARRAWATVETPGASLEATPTTVEADEERLAELLGNLFRNALEHGAADGDRPIAVRVGPLGGDDAGDGKEGRDGFYVEDDGVGIPPDRRERVFDPGETTGEDGIGYGLAIVSRIGDAHGWSVSVTESETGGARFEFRTGS